MLNIDELASSIEGEVHTDKILCTLLATDAGIFQIEPKCVVYPKNTDDVVKTLKFASKKQLSVHPRGAGSGLCGSAIGEGIVIDFSKFMNKLLHLDIEKRSFACEPGYRCGELEQEILNTSLFFPPTPSSGEYATFGGMYGTNAGGAYSVKYGNVADYILDAEIVFSNGSVHCLAEISTKKAENLPPYLRELWKILHSNKKTINSGYPDVPTNVCGYELRQAAAGAHLNLLKLFGGSEGTLGIVTKLFFKLVEKPKHTTLVIAYFPDIVRSAKAAQLALSMNPAGIEIMDKSLLEIAEIYDPSFGKHIPSGTDNVLMINFEANDANELVHITNECVAKINRDSLAKEIFTALTEEENAQFWAVRKAAVPILYLLKGEKKIVPLVEDAAIPADRIVAYVSGLYKIFESFGVRFVIYGHIAKGLLHSRPLINMKDPLDVAILKPLADEVFNLVRSLGGTISGEHGDGRLRSAYVPKQYWDIYEIFCHVKRILDPENLLNPNIIIGDTSEDFTKNLRYGWNYKAHEPSEKGFIWEGGMVQEVEKCHGCSKCTTVTEATRMCPVYKAVREEEAAPKAKANILRALISGNIRSKEQYSALFMKVINSCINCGSCSIECPSKVNISKLSMEAKSRYIFKFGAGFDKKIAVNIEVLGKHARQLFPILTPFMKTAPVKKLTELITGISAKRLPVNLAFRSLFDRIKGDNVSFDRKVLYFAGCYASYVRPSLGETAVRILNKAGYTVLIPEQHCCGVPHASKGFSYDARRKVEDNLRKWGHLLDTVDYIVVSCSSCGLALIKEWSSFLGGDLTERVKTKTVHISTLLGDLVKGIKAPDFSVCYHAPCHMLQLPVPYASRDLLKSIKGVKTIGVSNNCCGMAGSWGMHRDNYKLSVLIASPILNSLDKQEADICATDCPTCEMQLRNLTPLNIVHPVEVIAALI